MFRIGLSSRYGFLVLAMCVGLTVGFSVVAFLELIEWIQGLFFTEGSEKRFATIASQSPWWVILLAPALGGLIVGLLITWLIPEKRSHGVADVIEASALKGGKISAKTGLVSILAASTALGSGASVGREGPAVHMGATWGSWLAKRLNLTSTHTLTLVGCGVAAAVAGSFNAPIAGVFFALEVVLGQYALKVFAPVVIASVSSTVVCRQLLGDSPAFALPEQTTTSLWEVFAFGLLGVTAALLGKALIESIESVQSRWAKTQVPGWLRPGLAGLAIGGMGIFYPHILSVGYEATNLALTESLTLFMLAALLLTKFIATALALGSGMAGGIFSPSLFLGAMLGGIFWHIAQPVAPEFATNQAGYAIVGMASVAAAVLGAPISTLLIVFELTADYRLTIAVMIGTTIANLILQQLGHRSFFHWQLKMRGVSINYDRNELLLHSHSIEPLISQQYGLEAPDHSLQQGSQTLMASPHYVLLLVDDNGAFSGSVRSKVLMTELLRSGQNTALQEIASPRDVCVLPNASLQTVLAMMSKHDMNYLPVVKDLQTYQLVGIVYQVDVLDYMNHSLVEED